MRSKFGWSGTVLVLAVSCLIFCIIIFSGTLPFLRGLFTRKPKPDAAVAAESTTGVMQAFKPKKRVRPVVQEEPKTESTPTETTEPITTPDPIEEKQPDVEAVQPQGEVQREESKTENINPEPEPQQAEAEAETPKAEPTPEIPVSTDEPAVEEEAPATKSAESLLLERMEEQPARRSFKWLYISISIIILLAGAGAVCYFCFPELFSHPAEPKQPVASALSKPKPTPPVPVAQKKDTVVKSETAPVQKTAPEKPKDVFSEQRVYKEFIATETATEGTWLTMFFGANISMTIVNELTAVGGILLIGVALSILEVKKIKVTNMLPALIFICLFVWCKIHLFS